MTVGEFHLRVRVVKAILLGCADHACTIATPTMGNGSETIPVARGHEEITATIG